jgi:hypothetical protein
VNPVPAWAGTSNKCRDRLTEGIARAPEAWQTAIKKLGAKDQRAHTRRRDHGE